MSQENVEKIRKGIEDFNRRDFDSALTTVADDIIWSRSCPALRRPCFMGRRKFGVAWEGQAEMMDLRVEPEEFIAVGDDRVVVPMRLIAWVTAVGCRWTLRSLGFSQLLTV
jgi:SnoaL-like domain